jgi:glycosyltransferase involved in cell wall biosynthesis
MDPNMESRLLCRVSVIVPNYNHAPYLERRFDSIFAQTYQDFELIILDDCSTDNSREVLEKYRNHPKVSQVVYNEKNSGSTFKQWNKGVAMAKGEYIWIAESDDEAESEFLETLVSELAENPNVGIAYCQSNLIDNNSNILGSMEGWANDIHLLKWKMNFISSGKEECAHALFVKNIIPNASAVVFKKDVFMRSGQAAHQLKLCGDWMTWINMLFISDLAFISKCLNRYRSHPGTVRSKNSKHNESLEDAKIRHKLNCCVKVSEATLLAARKDIFYKWQSAIHFTPNKAGWIWMIKLTFYLQKCGGSFLRSLWLEFIKHRMRFGLIGRGYRCLKSCLKLIGFKIGSNPAR